MTDDVNDNQYEVGYGRPPKDTQFKPGQSGNPKGRPKGAKNVGSMLVDVFFRKIPITENGSRQQVTILEAILKEMATGAAKGDPRLLDRVIKLLPMLQEAREVTLTGGDTSRIGDATADVAVLEALADMFGSDPDDLFASLQGGQADDE